MNNIYSQCIVSDNIIKLPDYQLSRELYLEIKKQFTGFGGKWKGGKIQGFVFEFDPTKLLERLINGEENIQKKIQFFPTPSKLASKIVDLAEIKSDQLILEPSAGQGAIVSQIIARYPDKVIDVCEIDPINTKVLTERFSNNINLVANDFISLASNQSYHRIIANPPFSKNQDIMHILKMYECLAPGGVLTSFMSTSWQYKQSKLVNSFKDWLDCREVEIFPIDRHSFSESGTEIPTIILKIRKGF